MSTRAGRYICPCTFVDGKVYPDPRQFCLNGHTRGQAIDEAYLLADLDAILEEANTQHRNGCSIERSGKCICTYIGKWDPK